MTDTSTQGAGRQVGSYSNTASLRVAVGPLAGPLVCRVVSIVAARADCPLDRLDDALLVCDAITAHAPAHVPDGHVALTVDARQNGLQLRLGPLAPGGGQGMIAAAAMPGIGNVLERVSDALRVETGTHGETLLIEIGF